jgi:hypothetical protein
MPTSGMRKYTTSETASVTRYPVVTENPVDSVDANLAFLLMGPTPIR